MLIYLQLSISRSAYILIVCFLLRSLFIHLLSLFILLVCLSVCLFVLFSVCSFFSPAVLALVSFPLFLKYLLVSLSLSLVLSVHFALYVALSLFAFSCICFVN